MAKNYISHDTAPLKLEGIRGDLVGTDDDWQDWDFPKFLEALRKWTERIPIPVKSVDNTQDSQQARRTTRHSIYHTQQREERLSKCVYCGSADHRPYECNKGTEPVQRRRILIQKRICFNCTSADHKVAE